MTATPTAWSCSTGSPIDFPGLDLAQHSVEWTTLDDGHEALLVDGGGIDGGQGTFFANYGEDLHAVGMLDPIVRGTWAAS